MARLQVLNLPAQPDGSVPYALILDDLATEEMEAYAVTEPRPLGSVGMLVFPFPVEVF